MQPRGRLPALMAPAGAAALPLQTGDFALFLPRCAACTSASRAEGKAYWNRGVAATWTTVDAGGAPQASRLCLGRLQSVWQLSLAGEQRTLLKVRWYDARAVVPEPDYPGRLPLLCVHTRAAPLFEPEEQLVEAASIDSQCFLSVIAGSRDQRVHFKLPAGYSMPAHLRGEHLEPLD